MRNNTSSALLFLLLVVSVKEIHCSLRQLKLHEFRTKLQSLRSPTLPAGATTPKSIGRVFYPIGYGADPKGVEDSSAAIVHSLSDALKSVQNGTQLLPGINDLGGVVIDFQGGSFKISSPIRVPFGAGNVLIHGGTLRASDTFPGDRHLIELWSPDSELLADKDKTIFYEDITFRDILFDSGYRGGGLLVVDSARIRVNSCFFLHFTTQGIIVERGHETFISSCFLGEHSTVGGDPGEKYFSGTGIDLASNDNLVVDVAIFSAATGIILRGQANTVTGVHCYNKATYFGGVGILVRAAQTRIDSCYLDYNAIVIEDPAQVIVTNGFFLGNGNVVLKSIKGRVSGLTVMNNMFVGDHKKMVPIVTLAGEFSSIDQVVIDHNNVDGMRVKSTAGRMTVAGNGTMWTADFSDLLVFPKLINHVYYSFYAQSLVGFPAHAVTKLMNNVVVVETEAPVNGVVSVVVDQHNVVGEKNYLM